MARKILNSKIVIMDGGGGGGILCLSSGSLCY